MGVIHRQFKDFDGPFSYAAWRNRNFLTLAADQNLNAQGVRTLKGNGSVCHAGFSHNTDWRGKPQPVNEKTEKCLL